MATSAIILTKRFKQSKMVNAFEANHEVSSGGWSRLDSDLLHLVLSLDATRVSPKMALVCRGWRGAVVDTIRDLRPSDVRCCRKFRKLRRLDLTRCTQSVTDASLASLGGYCGDIEDIRLTRTDKVTDAGIRTVVHELPKLRSLALADCWGLTDATLVELEMCGAALSSVDFSGCLGINAGALDRFLRASKRSLQQVALEEMLSVGQFAVTDETLKVIGSLPHLTKLNLAANEGFSEVSLRHLGKLSNLRHLDVANCGQIGDEGLQCFHLLRLKSLNLSALPVTDSAVLELLKMQPGLRRLRLCACEALTGHALERLAVSNPLLEELALNNNTFVNDATVCCLASLTGLRSLDLSYCVAITDASLPWLGRFARLQHLSLAGCLWVTGRAPHDFTSRQQLISDPSSMPTLSHPSRLLIGTSSSSPSPLSSNDSDPEEGTVAHVRLWNEMTQLTSLDMSASGLTDDGLETVQALSGLRNLDVSCCWSLSLDSLVRLLMEAGTVERVCVNHCPNVCADTLQASLDAAAGCSTEISNNHASVPSW